MEGREDRMIEIRELTKRFDGEKAVDNITTTIHEGQIFGLVEAMEQEKVRCFVC